MSAEPNCNGLCLSASDIGLPSSDIAYPHPTCPAHGENPDHPFELGHADNAGRLMCACGGYQLSHDDQRTEALLDLELKRELAYGCQDNAMEIASELTLIRLLDALEKRSPGNDTSA